LILHESATIMLKKPEDGRNSAWVSLDGATRFELSNGEIIKIKTSKFRVGFITNPTDNLTNLWSLRLTKLLNWNRRPNLKPLKKE
jgi:NAD kinase